MRYSDEMVSGHSDSVSGPFTPFRIKKGVPKRKSYHGGGKDLRSITIDDVSLTMGTGDHIWLDEKYVIVDHVIPHDEIPQSSRFMLVYLGTEDEIVGKVFDTAE